MNYELKKTLFVFNRVVLVRGWRDIAVRGALDPPDLLRAGDVVVENGDAGRRAGVVAETRAGDVHKAGLRNVFRHVDGIIVAEGLRADDAPSAVDTAEELLTAHVAAPRNARISLRELRFESASPAGLEATLAAAVGDEILTIPFIILLLT